MNRHFKLFSCDQSVWVIEETSRNHNHSSIHYLYYLPVRLTVRLEAIPADST